MTWSAKASVITRRRLKMRFALLDKRAHALLCIGELGRGSHDFNSISVSLLLGQVYLSIICLLANAFREKAAACSRFQQLPGDLYQQIRWHYTIYQAPGSRGFGID